MNIIFSEYKPGALLQPYVQTYWTGHFNIDGSSGFSQSVLPNGCIELIIHLDEEHCALAQANGQYGRSPDFTLLGLYEQPYEVQFDHPVQVFGIRFFPDGIHNIFGVPPSVFMATYEDSIDVLGRELLAFCEQVQATGDDRRQVALADEFLLGQLHRHAQGHDYTHAAMQMIRSSMGAVAYHQLLKEIPISPRQLQREFKLRYGITITDYMRLSRMNAIHRYMQSGQASLTELSYDFNFTDQSHFIREFKTFSGIAPRKFLKDREGFIVN